MSPLHLEWTVRDTDSGANQISTWRASYLCSLFIAHFIQMFPWCILFSSERLLGKAHSSEHFVHKARKVSVNVFYLSFFFFKKNKQPTTKTIQKRKKLCGESERSLQSANMFTTVQMDTSSFTLCTRHTWQSCGGGSHLFLQCQQ